MSLKESIKRAAYELGADLVGFGDVDLDLPIPDVVDEKVILDAVAEHGLRSGEMGQCLKFCLPKPLRTLDRSYSKTPMRKYATTDPNVTESLAASFDHILVPDTVSGPPPPPPVVPEPVTAVGMVMAAGMVFGYLRRRR